METVHVALLQLIPAWDLAGNLSKGRDACRQAKAMGAAIALFPEMWHNGYRVAADPDMLRRDAIASDDPFILAFRDLARELDMAIGITFLERYEPAPRNTLVLFDRLGRRVMTYAKVHTCDFDTERHMTPGDAFQVADLDLRSGTVRIGAMICFDREFPESARILMLQGAEIILVPNACPLEINRLAQLRARAFENMLGIATANYARGQPDCNGHSSAFDGIAYREGEPGSRDTLIVEAGEAEGIVLAAFPLGELRRYREREVHGNAYRRPNLYHPLVSGQVQAPFIRKDHRQNGNIITGGTQDG